MSTIPPMPTVTLPPIPAVTPTGGSTATPVASGSNSALGKDQFLQLMMAELKNQNPMDASSNDPTKYITELAQFTSLEQQTNTAQSAAQSATSQRTSAAVALLGHSVGYLDSSGNAGSGVVQKVDITSAGPTLTVSGTTGIDPASVNQVS
jgi:flagellar basal-body rod modification protein FlgD